MAVTTLSNLTGTTDSINNISKALDFAMPYLAYAMFGQKDSIAERSGKNLKWYRHATAAETTATLAENPTWAPATHSVDTVTANLAFYGDGKEITELLDIQSVFDLRPDLLVWAGEAAGKSINAVTRNTLTAGTSATAVYAAGTTSATITTAATATLDDIIDTARILKTNDAPSFNIGGQQCYVAVISEYVEARLMKTTAFRDAVRYADANRLFNGYLGSLFGVCFVRSSTTAPATANTIQVDQTLVIGRGAYGVPALPLYGQTGKVPAYSGIAVDSYEMNNYTSSLMDMFKILVTPPGDGTGGGAHGDEWGTRFKVAYKAYWTAVILNSSFIQMYRSAR